MGWVTNVAVAVVVLVVVVAVFVPHQTKEGVKKSIISQAKRLVIGWLGGTYNNGNPPPDVAAPDKTTPPPSVQSQPTPTLQNGLLILGRVKCSSDAQCLTSYGEGFCNPATGNCYKTS